MSSNLQKVYKVVSGIPEGKVATYQDVAKLSGIMSPRVVGSMLHKNKDSKSVPCHRVVHKDGSLAKNYAFGGITKQEERLRGENIEFINGYVNMDKHLWQHKK